MSTVVIQTSRVHQLARRLEDDIRYREFGPGDRYLTGGEAAEMLGVSAAMANRAMQLLAKREVVVRGRSRGTFVGPAVDARKPARLRTIHFVLPADRVNRCSYDELAEGACAELSVGSVQFSRLPRDNAVQCVEDLIERGTRSGMLFGLIALSCSHGVYSCLQRQTVPCAVLGSLYPDTERLASLDVDMRQAGRLMTEYLVEHGHRRLALLMGEHWRPGDNILFEGITKTISAAGLSHDALVVRSMADKMEVMVGEVRALLASADRPTGFICHARLFVQAVKNVARSMGLAVPGDVEIVLDGPSASFMTGLNVPCCLPELDTSAMAGVLAHMLSELSEGREPEPRHIVVPCALYKEPRDIP